MIPIFDLDDTLYPEHEFVESGFRAVAEWLAERFGWDANESLRAMLEILDKQGRGKVFNNLLARKNQTSVNLVKSCVKIYRHHLPKITLAENVEQLLSSFTDPIYLVTDGHKIAQENKVRALKIEHFFKKVFITHRYGIKHAKPSTHCFKIIRKIEGCAWSDMFYVGDNPYKDFVNLTPLGIKTVRVLTGEHRNVDANPDFEALYRIESLSELPKLIRQWK